MKKPQTAHLASCAGYVTGVSYLAIKGLAVRSTLPSHNTYKVYIRQWAPMLELKLATESTPVPPEAP